MLTLYLDETGDHSLEKIDPTYPVFVLGGIIIDDSELADLDRRVRELKENVLGSEDVVLRTADIRRNRNGFESLQNMELRERFYLELNQLMADVDFTVVACAIQKYQHLSRYGAAAIDPYMLSLNVLVERFCFELARLRRPGRIVAERRDPVLDRQLEISWMSLTISGTQYVTGSQIRARISELQLRHKRDNISGLQLADLVVSPIGRYILGKKSHEDWSIIESKFRRHRGSWRGAGLVTLPKE